MKKSSLCILAALFTGAILSANACINNKQAPGDSKGFAVVELFTSEGCSSCPPADAVIAKIEKESADKRVYILAYHVDYWDRLGWKDVFSNAAFSNRQRQYARTLHLSSVYTPQAIVNGKTELVGSEGDKLRSLITSSLQNQPAAQLSLSDIKADKNKIGLHYRTGGNNKDDVLMLALVQKSAQNKVERGENAGRTLSHVQIVRGLQSITIKGNDGNAAITLPDNNNIHGYELIAFLQNNKTGTITAATKSAL